MAKRIPESQLLEIETVASQNPTGLRLAEIADRLTFSLPRRTLQYRLQHLVESGRLIKEGSGRWVRYLTSAPGRVSSPSTPHKHNEHDRPTSPASQEISEYVRRPLELRQPIGYNRDFLEAYRPNVSAYLTDSEKTHLQHIGSRTATQQPAGTYARQILNRLLIDLSWNSSRLEGNTYSLLDTKRLIHFGASADGKNAIEAQMVLNHKDAIEFLVDSAEEIGFNRYTILNLHALLANNLLPDPRATGRLRQIAVGIHQSVFQPLEVPQQIAELFDLLLGTAEKITNPFERALFVMVQLPYLQPFDDVNKRVSRLAANIPFIRQNLIPLSFNDVPLRSYTEAVLGVYELNRIDLIKELFIWAYERSAQHYTAVRQSLDLPDPFRLKYRADLQTLVVEVVRSALRPKQALDHLIKWSKRNIRVRDRESFRELVENELLSLHEGNFARYRIKPSEFKRWQATWQSSTLYRGD